MTTRGLKEKDMAEIARAIHLCLNHNDADRKKAAEIVKEITTAFPLYEA